MLDRVDRIQMAVAEATPVARAFQGILGAELCAPRGAGVVRAHLDRWGPGLLTAGFSVASVPALRAKEGDQTETIGMRVVISPAGPRPAGTQRMTGLVRHLYEVTNTIGSDWTAAAERYPRLFGLDPARFSPIHRDRFGYTGTLTLFDPPGRLDRIEISQVTDPKSLMGRWAAKRGDFIPRGGDPLTERDGLWIHPSALSGLLLGISRATGAWEWSGRPELVAH
jgi:hypothetical protein